MGSRKGGWTRLNNPGCPRSVARRRPGLGFGFFGWGVHPGADAGFEEFADVVHGALEGLEDFNGFLAGEFGGDFLLELELEVGSLVGGEVAEGGANLGFENVLLAKGGELFLGHVGFGLLEPGFGGFDGVALFLVEFLEVAEEALEGLGGFVLGFVGGGK